jgi:hypothetical protein
LLLVGPDRNTHLRNAAIVLALAVLLWKLPGGGTAATVINNVLGIVFAGGLLFFGYRLYMEHRTAVFMLEDRTRALLYASGLLAAFALVATGRLWEQGGVGVVVWLALLGAAAYGIVTVYRASREY